MGHRVRIMDLVLRMGLVLRDLRPPASFPSFKSQSILVNSMNKGFKPSTIESGDSGICPIFQIEAGRTSGLSLFRLSRLNRMVVLDSLSVSETKCWWSCRKPVVIKGPSSPIHDHLRVEELVGNQGGANGKRGIRGLAREEVMSIARFQRGRVRG